jgi:hypothetical protein
MRLRSANPPILPRRTWWRAVPCLLLLVAAVTPVAAGDDPNACDAPGDEPDVIVGNLHQTDRHGPVGDVTAFAIGTVSCNIGTCWLDWFQSPSNQHPVIGQNMFRLKDGRFEQLGQSWLKHGFFALSQNFCSNDCQGTTGNHLGVNCSDPYSSFLNGQQSNLGPKFEVNATTGVHPHPVTDLGQTGNAIFKRLQVHNDDLDPALNPDALYFIEGQYVTADDAAADNQDNNASYRKVTVSGSSGIFDISFDGPTQQQLPAIRAWAVHDTGVAEVDVHVPNDGLYILASKVTDLGGGMWHYEYALHNLNSHRSARAFSVPIPAGATVTNVGFHDVEYHSGEPFSLDDWADNGGSPPAVVWNTDTFDHNEDANALRWGTLYNFRFDADVEPSINEVTIELFRPGTPTSVTAQTLAPNICDFDDVCDPGENVCNCSADCGPPPAPELACGDLVDNDCDLMVDCIDPDCCGDKACFPDNDGDQRVGCLDCNDDDGDAWATPGEANDLILVADAAGTVLTWSEPADLGSDSVDFDVLRSVSPRDFTTPADCLSGPDPSATTFTDTDVPSGLFAYLVRATNTCPDGDGTLGTDSDGIPRVGRICP